ncbi:MAG TPA: ABC transporter permease [Bacteroidia bacterium]|nr:ABC transporter permease [Bacteroidota bacterium]MBL0053565.1 ABC transporter permease [Bacteroidota bacterium]HRC32310.1 ABC transporter permease [Bacteroidia bacterium]
MKENIRIAVDSIKGQLLRSLLTAGIIAIGIFALVGIFTCIDALQGSISSGFSNMGANSFTIDNRERGIRMGGGGRRKMKRYVPITYKQAQDFKERFHYPASVSISAMASTISTLKYKKEKTNPNIFVFGGDENYLQNSGLKIGRGRNFNNFDMQTGNNSVIIGSDIAFKLFKTTNPVGKEIKIGVNNYNVIGVLEEKGASFGMSADKNCYIPITNLKENYASSTTSYSISVMVNNVTSMENAIGEATGYMRSVRSDALGGDNSFQITKSDGLANMVISTLSNIKYSAVAFAVITLLGAAIGLMNIMLVSVTERTREIGIRKALGATSVKIRLQFLVEAIIICIIGGAAGIVLGVFGGLALAIQMGVGLTMPWLWILMGLIVCIVVGIISGIYPAYKASKLDPIEALRYE